MTDRVSFGGDEQARSQEASASGTVLGRQCRFDPPSPPTVTVTWTVEYEADWLPTDDAERDAVVEILMDHCPQGVTVWSYTSKEFEPPEHEWKAVGWMVDSAATGDMRMGSLTEGGQMKGAEGDD